MSYEKQTWYDDPSGGTPLTADKMNHIEDGIEENSNNWDSISREEYGIATSSSVAARGSTVTEITFDTPFSEPPCVFVQDRSGGGNVSDMINNKTIVSDVTLGGFTARSFNNTSTTFPDGMTFYWRAVGK